MLSCNNEYLSVLRWGRGNPNPSAQLQTCPFYGDLRRHVGLGINNDWEIESLSRSSTAARPSNEAQDKESKKWMMMTLKSTLKEKQRARSRMRCAEQSFKHKCAGYVWEKRIGKDKKRFTWVYEMSCQLSANLLLSTDCIKILIWAKSTQKQQSTWTEVNRPVLLQIGALHLNKPQSWGNYWKKKRKKTTKQQTPPKKCALNCTERASILKNSKLHKFKETCTL